jgi:hypothetical protein
MASHEEVLASRPAMSAIRHEHIFYTGMASAILLTILAGFGGSYFRRVLTEDAPFSALVHLHAGVFTVWVLLFFTQTVLVAARQTRLHRRLGVAGGVLAGLMIVLGLVTAIRGARNGHNPGGPYPDALAFLVVGLTDILLFSCFVIAGLYYRRRREAHQRLMLLATIGGLMWPAITRVPYVRGQFLPMFGLLTLFVLAGPVNDLLTRRRVHAVYIWGGSLILASFPIRRAIGLSETWHRIAAWLIG